MSKNDIVILGLLSECPMHGYQIHQQIKLREMDYWAKIKLPSIYTTLTRLEEQGLITSGKEKVGKMPERTVYSLTPAGREKLAELVEYFLRTEEVSEWLFGLGIAFIRGARREKVLEALQLRRQNIEKHLTSLNEELARHKDKAPFNWYMLIEHANKQIQFELEWIDQLIDTVQTVEHWKPELECHECAENENQQGG
ncbi:MAG: PadR family transcriptional regulator [candidate division KSB1 bacterium]|nr:PadR family transcriptional regulator [candidate division KSB1 bacterium]MDZ7304623.1 PadR family transcriptional regulator [candidate division KSB1 bacterium]